MPSFAPNTAARSQPRRPVRCRSLWRTGILDRHSQMIAETIVNSSDFLASLEARREVRATSRGKISTITSRRAIVLYVRYPHVKHVRSSSGLPEELPVKRGRTEVSAPSSWQRWCRRQAQYHFKLSCVRCGRRQRPCPQIRAPLAASVSLMETRKPSFTRLLQGDRDRTVFINVERTISRRPETSLTSQDIGAH